MDVTEENMTQKEMLEKIAELDYSQSQLKDLNVEMRHWLDVADDEMAVLRSENAALKKQVKVLESMAKTQQVEAEPCSTFLAEELDLKRCIEKKIQELEMESTTMKEQNKKLTAELKILQEERDRDKISLSNLRISLQTLECGIEEAQLGLQHRDDVIYQKNLEFQHSEETLEECSNIIKDLRLTNHELRKQLEDSQDEASFTNLNDQMGEKEGSISLPLSFAEEIKLLVSSAEQASSFIVAETSKPVSRDLRHEEPEAEDPPKPQSLTVDLQTERSLDFKWCKGAMQSAVQRAGLCILFFFMLTLLALVASGGFVGNYYLFPFRTLWSGTRLVLQPYCSVHYGALPPI